MVHVFYVFHSSLLLKGSSWLLDNDDINNSNSNFMEDDLSRTHSPYPDPLNSGRLFATTAVQHGNGGAVGLAKVSEGEIIA